MNLKYKTINKNILGFKYIFLLDLLWTLYLLLLTLLLLIFKWFRFYQVIVMPWLLCFLCIPRFSLRIALFLLKLQWRSLKKRQWINVHSSSWKLVAIISEMLCYSCWTTSPPITTSGLAWLRPQPSSRSHIKLDTAGLTRTRRIQLYWRSQY